MNISRFVRRDVELPLLLGVLLAIAAGITLIYSATYDWDLGTAGVTYQKQIVWAVIAFIALGTTAAIPLKLYYAFAYILYGLAMALLLLVLEFGQSRWFDLGPVHIQPSELAKIATVLAIARYLSGRNVRPDRARTFLVPFLFVALPCVLVVKQPDLGTALVFGAVLIPMLFWAGMPLINLFFIVSPVLSLICAFHPVALGVLYFLMIGVVFCNRPRLGTVGLLAVANLTIAVGAPYLWENKLHDYQRDRITTFINPDRDRLGRGYQVIQSKVAIGSGGLRGKGYLEGTQTKLAFLPEQHTDFIFSVVGEEFGFIGAVAVLALFVFLIHRAMKIAVVVKSRFSSLVAVGLTSILVFHMFVNIGMTIGVMPVTGIPLPFLSYGGSPLVMSTVLVGFLVSIYARRHEYY